MGDNLRPRAKTIRIALGTGTSGKIWPVPMCRRLHGDDDRMVAVVADGQRTAKLVKGARLHVVKGGPHCITWTRAEKGNAELLSFLGERAAGA